MKINKALIEFLFVLSIPSVNAKRYCTALGECNLSPSGSWDFASPRGFRTGNRVIDHMSEILSVPVRLNSLFEQQQRQLSNMYYHSVPRYDISEDDTSMELAFDLPGVRGSDISLTLLDRNTVLKVTGSRKYKQYGQIVSSEFDQMFTIDPSVLDVEKIEARLSDGVLVISAPKLPRGDVAGEKKIPITIQATDKDILPNEEQEGLDENKSGVSEEDQKANVADDFEITEEEAL
jgi:HSP20 family molecular chaperone IbpA